MRTIISMLSCVILLAAGAASGAEFQPLGTLGIGGAGVARTFDAYAPYWNPAGLAFPASGFSSRLGGSAGIRINATMAENVDRLGKLDVEQLQDLSINNPGDTATNLRLTSRAAEFVGVLNDLERKEGTLTVHGGAVLGFQYGHFAVGGFSSMELTALPSTDTAAVSFGGVASVAELATAIGAGTATPGSFFDASQRAAIATAFNGNTGIANAFDSFYTANRTATGLSPEQLKDSLVKMGTALASGQTSLENNRSTLEYRGLILVDIPVSYGYPIDLGSFGKLGIGASAKVIWGRAFIGESQIVNVKDSGDIVRNATDHYLDTTTFGIDLGALWRYGDWLNVGVVAKNLNSPEFDSPRVTLPIRGTVQETIRVKPQVRAGIAVEPLSWLSLAADLDLTENETLLLGHKNRTLGGGIELHPFTWLKLRGGVYKNLAEGEIGIVPTFGLTLGSPWVHFDLDGATALENGQFEGRSYPREARAQFNLNVQF
jgi:F plasmid transfer operon protein TraF